MTLSLSSNHLTGRIPNNLSELESLEVMELSHNELSGALPSWLKELDFVELTHNHMSGTVPMEVCDVVGHTNLDRHVLDGNAGLEGCGDGVMAMAGMYTSRLDWIWPFVLGALVMTFLVARLALFTKHRCGECRCQCALPRWKCSCPNIEMPTCPTMTFPKMPKMPPMPSMSLPRIICPRIYLPSLPVFSRKKAKVLDESLSDFHMTQEWGTARRRWWQRKPADVSTGSHKNSEIAKKIKQQMHQPPPPPILSPVKHGESARPKMSRNNSWSALADRVESRRTSSAPTASSSAKDKKAKSTGDDESEEEVWFIPIPKNFDEQSAVMVDNGEEEIMDISVVKGEGGNVTDKTGKQRKKKKKKKKPQRKDDGKTKNNGNNTDDYGQSGGGWQETSRH